MLIAQFKTTIFLITLFLAVNIATKAYGTLQPPNPALRGFIEGCEDKPQPCWYGIVPLATTKDEAATILNTQKYEIDFPEEQGGQVMIAASATKCYLEIGLDYFGQQVLGIFARECSFSLGDVLTILGIPEYVNSGDLYSLDTPPMLFYANGTRLWLDPCCGFSLYSQFNFIDFQAYGESVRPPLRWRGFIPNVRYCQLEPEIMNC